MMSILCDTILYKSKDGTELSANSKLAEEICTHGVELPDNEPQLFDNDSIMVNCLVICEGRTRVKIYVQIYHRPTDGYRQQNVVKGLRP